MVEFLTSLRVMALKLLNLNKFISQNSKIYFNFLRTIASSDVTGGPHFIFELIESTCQYSVHPGNSRKALLVSLVKRHRFTSAQLFLVFRSENTLCTCSCTVGKKQVPFSMAIRNWELVHECFPKHSRMGTVRTK